MPWPRIETITPTRDVDLKQFRTLKKTNNVDGGFEENKQCNKNIFYLEKKLF